MALSSRYQQQLRRQRNRHSSPSALPPRPLCLQSFSDWAEPASDGPLPAPGAVVARVSPGDAPLVECLREEGMPASPEVRPAGNASALHSVHAHALAAQSAPVRRMQEALPCLALPCPARCLLPSPPLHLPASLTPYLQDWGPLLEPHAPALAVLAHLLPEKAAPKGTPANAAAGVPVSGCPPCRASYVHVHALHVGASAPALDYVLTGLMRRPLSAVRCPLSFI